MTLLITGPMIFVGGVACYLTLYLLSKGTDHFQNWGRNLATAWLFVMFFMFIDTWFVVTRVGGLHVIGKDGDIAVVLDGFLHWFLFSLGAGVTAYIVGRRERNG